MRWEASFFFVLVVATVPTLAFESAAQANCSTATMNQTGSTYDCAAGGSANTVYPATGSATYADACISISDNGTYFSASSTVNGNGGCIKNPNGTWDNCSFQNPTVITLGTSASDYNRMYNYAFDIVVESFGNCPQNGAWRQNLQQCLPVWLLSGTNCSGGSNGGSGGSCGGDYTTVGNGGDGGCGGNGSPIIVDTTGGGFHLTSADDGVMFDIEGDGRPVRLGWTAANSGNAFLALDRNHNGRIDSGKELFGNYTVQPASSQRNGYLALAEFDKQENGGNGDGIIDFRDAVYKDLLLWIDLNHDGISQPNELHRLPELGVFSISLSYRKEPLADQFGNQFRYRGVLNPDATDGESKDGRYTYDVFFAEAQHQVAKTPPAAGAGPLPETVISLADHSLKSLR